MPDLNGFTGSTTLLTSWGACRLHDLARLTAQRDRAAEAFAGKLAALLQAQAQDLAAFDTAAAEILADLPAGEQAPVAVQQAATREALVAEQAAIAAEVQAAIASDLAARLPLLICNGEPVPLQGVHAADPAAQVVDVTIAEIPVDGQALPIPVKVRCAPGCMFVGESGNVAASGLQGVAIHRVHADAPGDTFVVPAAAAIVCDPALPMFRVVAAADTCCVGADSMVAAVVRIS